jgi:hypothetical protein
MMLTEQEHLTLDAAEFRAAVETMMIGGEIEPLLSLFHERVIKVVGNRDLRGLDERAIKLMLLAFLSFSRLVHPLSENDGGFARASRATPPYPPKKELAQGYCDLFLGVSPLSTAARFAWLLELKYLPAGAKASQIGKAFAEAETQVARYASDKQLVPLLTRGQALKAGSLVFTGAKKVLFRPWPRSAEKPPETGKKNVSIKGRRAAREAPKARGRRKAGGR